MPEGEEKVSTMSPDDAQVEAEMLRGPFSSWMKEVIQHAATRNAQLDEFTRGFGDTAYLELGNQQIEVLKEKRPDMYKAMLDCQRTRLELAATWLPSFLPDTGKKRIQSERENSATHNQHEAAWEKAIATADSAITHYVAEAKSKLPKDQITLAGDINKAVFDAIQTDLTAPSYTHFLDHSSPQDRIGATYPAVLAALELDRLESQYGVFGLKEGAPIEGVDINEARRKQDVYYDNKQNL